MAGRARAWHLFTFGVATAALVLQFALVWSGHAVLDETDPPGLGTRVTRYFCYFTILSNMLVAGTSFAAARVTHSPSDGRTHRAYRVLRLNAIVAILVTAIVHWILLRPLLDLSGIDWVTDKLLHVVVPLLAVAGWVAFGPRGLVRREDLLPSALFPAAYVVVTLIHGALSDWYPYPFVDVNEHGYAVVLLNGVGVMALIVGLSFGAWWLDRRLSAAQPTH